MEVGVWVQVSLGFFWENHSKIALNKYCFWSTVPCIFCLIKVIQLLRFEYSVHVSDGFPKKMDGGGWGELYPNLF